MDGNKIVLQKMVLCVQPVNKLFYQQISFCGGGGATRNGLQTLEFCGFPHPSYIHYQILGIAEKVFSSLLLGMARI